MPRNPGGSATRPKRGQIVELSADHSFTVRYNPNPTGDPQDMVTKSATIDDVLEFMEYAMRKDLPAYEAFEEWWLERQIAAQEAA